MSMPKGWEEVRLGDICDKLGDGIHTTPKYDDNGEYFFINGNNLENGKIVFKEDTKRASEEEFIKHKRELNDRTILVSINGTLGNVATYNNEKCILGKSACYFNVSQGVSKEFIKQVVMHRDFQNYIRLSATGTTIPNVSLAVMRTYKFKLPPLKEQEKIAEILSSCDEHIKNLKNLKSELEKEKLHLMNELLSGKTRFANFTTPWQEVALKDLGEYRRGSFPQPYGNKEWYDGEGSMPFVQVFDVDDNFKLKPTTLKRISKLAQPKSIFIPKGSVIITIQGSIGRTAITQYDCYLDRTLLYFEKFLIPIDKKFFMYALFSVFEVEKLKAPGGTIKTITKEALSDFKIKLPSLEEQKKIGEVLSACDERLECLNELITAETTLKSHLLTELLTGNLRVKDFQ